MKKLMLLMLVFCLAACAYNSVTVTAQGDVTCNASVDKPTTVSPTLQADGNTVPVSP